MRWLDDLNEQQRAAVEAKDGPLLIVAGPGTGKTKTLTGRIAYVIATSRAKPQEILALTFTKKAAEEMALRVAALLDYRDDPSASQRRFARVYKNSHREFLGSTTVKSPSPSSLALPRVSTFHALCHELLGDTLAGLTFVSEPVRLQIIKKLSRPAKFKSFSAREVGLLISKYKNMADDDTELVKLVEAYDAALHEQHLLDFDDLLVKVRDMLQQDAAKRKAIQQQYKYVLVDEFQDTNKLQYELLKLLLGHDNIFVIGDPNQSIYGFRGASGGIFDVFRQDFPEAMTITLTTNYRSSPPVVGLANAIFPEAARLAAYGEVPGSVRTVEVLNEYSEANWVLNEIQRLVGGGDFMHAVSDDERSQHRTLRDFAILYRNRSAAVAVQKAVADSGLPYQIVGDGSPYDRPEVQALMALMRAAANGGEQPAHEGFSETEWKAVLELMQADATTRPDLFSTKTAEILGFGEKPDVQQFIGTLVRFGDLPSALAYLDRLADKAFYDPEADVVTLLTIHASKGLEFPHVFLLAAEEGVLPHGKAALAEERRLFYVAATRAMQRLDILHTRKRGSESAVSSRFIRDISDAVLLKTVDPNLADDARRAQKRAIKRSQQSLF